MCASVCQSVEIREQPLASAFWAIPTAWYLLIKKNIIYMWEYVYVHAPSIEFATLTFTHRANLLPTLPYFWRQGSLSLTPECAVSAPLSGSPAWALPVYHSNRHDYPTVTLCYYGLQLRSICALQALTRNRSPRSWWQNVCPFLEPLSIIKTTNIYV